MVAIARRRKGGQRARQSDERRAAFAEAPPKAVKRVTGRSTTTETPFYLRAPGLDLEDGLRDYARKRVGFKLGKFGLAITRASVRFEDISGPKGAKVYECRLKVVLRYAGDVMVGHRGPTQRAAFDTAADAAERSVRRALDKQVRATRRTGTR